MLPCSVLCTRAASHWVVWVRGDGVPREAQRLLRRVAGGREVRGAEGRVQRWDGQDRPAADAKSKLKTEQLHTKHESNHDSNFGP